MIVLALLLASALAGEPELTRVDAPVEFLAPAPVAAKWRSFDGLSAAALTEAVQVRATGAPPGSKGRIDVLRRGGGSWLWTETHASGPELTLPRRDFDRAVLLRFPGDPLYYWGEIPAGTTASLELHAFRNLSIRGSEPGDTGVLFHDRENVARTIAQGEHPIRFVPAGRAIFCALGALDSRCALVEEAGTEVELSSSAAGDVRVFRFERQGGAEVDVLAPGTVAIRPKKIAAAVIDSGAWTAVTLPAPHGWEDIVVDRSGDDLALQRTEGSTLPALPAFAQPFSVRERGLVVRPWVGPDKHPLTDTAAMLVVFPQNEKGISSQVPLATAAPDKDGLFALPSLASGTYVFKLLSSASAAGTMKATATSGTPLDIVFPGGPSVTGRIVRSAGGNPADPVYVEVSQLMTLAEASQGDAIDKVRFTNADETGAFNIIVSVPGRYRLHAQWGSASAERDFEIGSKTREVQLGDISLVLGATLRGSVDGCVRGEAVLIPVPDVSKPLTLAGPMLRRVAIDDTGHFLAEGLDAGNWSVLFKCDGISTGATPEMFTMPERGDAIVEFTRSTAPDAP